MDDDVSTEERVRVCAKAAMRAKLMDTLAQDAMTAEDVAWIEALCTELKTRIGRLTPNRSDLARAWDTEFDVALFVQMLRHHAVDTCDADAFVRMVFERLKMLCAPVQDEAVLEAETTILAEADKGKKLALLLEVANEVLTDIESMLRTLRADR